MRSHRSARRARVALGFLSAALLAPPVAAQSREALGDREFWELFANNSEDGGNFASENFVSNEKTYQYVIPSLRRTLSPNGVYLGVGPEQNFTYIVNLKPRLAVIVDIRRQNAMLHLMYKALFELSPTRAEFLSRLFARPLPRTPPASAPPESLLAVVATAAASDSAFDANWKMIVNRLTVTHRFPLAEADLASLRHVYEAFHEAGPEISFGYRLGAPPSRTQWFVTFADLQSMTNADGVNEAFLASERNYQWLRGFEARNLVVPVVGDFAGAKAIRGLGAYLAARHAVVTAFYVSNVEQYLFTGFGADKRFYRSVAALPIDSTSMFIRAVPAPAQPVPTPSNTSAYLTGFAGIGVTLDAFNSGNLETYQQLTKLTQIEGWPAGAPSRP